MLRAVEMELWNDYKRVENNSDAKKEVKNQSKRSPSLAIGLEHIDTKQGSPIRAPKIVRNCTGTTQSLSYISQGKH